MSANSVQRALFKACPELAPILPGAFFANVKILSYVHRKGNDRQLGHSANSPCSVNSGLVIGSNKYMLVLGRN